MADTTTMQELLVTTFATADALAKLLMEKGHPGRVQSKARR